MKKTVLLLLSLITLSSMRAQVPAAQAQTAPPHRVIIWTDIEADPDDTQSLVRLLLYPNEIHIKGIVATTSCWKKNQQDFAARMDWCIGTYAECNHPTQVKAIPVF
jgi:hypothetical protein